jgi:hypothetical protein
VKFQIVDPRIRSVIAADTPNLNDACIIAGLSPLEVDHGTVARDDEGNGCAIVVYEFSLTKIEPKDGFYFSIGSQLFCGSAVLYAFDDTGEVDMESYPPIMFYKSYREVEAAIQRREIRRPYTAVNGEVLWQWGDKLL